MDWYEYEVAQLELTAKSMRLPEAPAVFYGSSSIRMWNTIGVDLASDRILNQGFGGATLAACVHFFGRLLPPVSPGSLVLYAGDNDLGDGCDAEQVHTSFKQFQRQVDTCLGDIPFAFLAIKPSPARLGILSKILKANALIAHSIADWNRPAIFIDTVNPMLDSTGIPDPGLFQEDGLHLSRAGYKLWARLLEPHRKQLLIEPMSKRNNHRVLSDQSEP